MLADMINRFHGREECRARVGGLDWVESIWRVVATQKPTASAIETPFEELTRTTSLMTTEAHILFGKSPYP
jgi:hypothetical protein